MSKKYNNYHAFDFECTSLEPAQLYLGSFVRLDNLKYEKVKTYLSIKDVVNYIFNPSHDNHIFYAHNLKYDLSFVLAYLFQNHADEFLIFDQVIMPMTKTIFTMKVVFGDVCVTFRDAYPLFTAPLANVAKSYTNYEKGETPIYDYIKDVEINEYNLKYSKMDVLILGEALIKRFEYGRGAITTASGAFKEFRHLTEQEYGKGNFRTLFPIISYEQQLDMRKAYRGGFTFLNPVFCETDMFHVKQIDVNSMYPAQMNNKLLPYGIPLIVEDGLVVADELYKLGIQKIVIKNCHVKDGFIPFLSNTNSFLATNIYRYDISEDEEVVDRTFYLTLSELELFYKSYNYDEIRYCGGYLFKARNDLFKSYVKKFWQMKMSSDPVIKALGKLFLNALYGKFAEGYEKIILELFYEGKITFKELEIEIRECGYLPVGIFITSYARTFLINSILEVGVDNFVYCDTDSIHFINNPDLSRLEFDNEELGKWSFKSEYDKAFYIRAKRYAGEYLDTKTGQIVLDIACAGIKKRDLKEQVLSLKDFRVGKNINTIEFKQGLNGMSVRPKIIRI